MNNPELDRLLRQAGLPQRTDQQWDELRADTLRRLQSSRPSPAADESVLRSRRWLAWAIGFAAACIAFGFVAGNWHAGRESRAHEVAEARKVLAELAALFPNQLEAVILDAREPRLLLSESATARQELPVLIRVCAGGRCKRIITFSGNRIQLNGQSWDVLLDARGHIIVAGEDFVWSSGDKKATASDYRIEAISLSVPL